MVCLINVNVAVHMFLGIASPKMQKKFLYFVCVNGLNDFDHRVQVKKIILKEISNLKTWYLVLNILPVLSLWKKYENLLVFS